jgi:hypothetical protein
LRLFLNDQYRQILNRFRVKTGLNRVKKNEPDGELSNSLTVYDPVLFKCPVIKYLDRNLIAF